MLVVKNRGWSCERARRPDSSFQGAASPYANRRHVEAFGVRADKRRRLLDAALAELIALCAKKPSIREAFVFGSYATGAVGPHSDLDLLVVRETDLPRLQRGDDLLIERDSPIPVDLLVVTPAEFGEQLARTSFGKTIVRSMRRVYAS